jgi:hypothetical protein
LLSTISLFGQKINYHTFGNIRLSAEADVINCFAQDKQGLIWIGSNKGLFSYDGYSAQPHFSVNEKSNTLIYCILPISSNYLYLGTDNGVLLYNITTDKYETTDTGFPTDVRAMAIKDDNLWIGSLNGLYRYNLKTKTLENISQAKDKFDAGDKRNMFFTENQSQYVTKMTDEFTGYLFEKWTNLTDAGQTASNTAADGASTDFPMFRLADIYLMYAEAALRGGTDPDGNAAANALTYTNKVRERAFGNTSGNISTGELTLDFILDERARELYLECTRRTDLIRFDKFTSGDYLWEFKGGEADGKAVDTKYNLFPIPETDLSANSNIKQNTGY